jgi:hypothetical protein
MAQDLQGDKPGKPTNLSWRWQFGYGLICLAVAGISLAFIARTLSQTSNKSLDWNDCGTNVDEARSRNCHYEPMNYAWVPDKCFFSTPMEEYHPFDDREWFLDSNLTSGANTTRLISGDELSAYTAYYHEEHCLYTWRKLAIAVAMKSSWIDSKSADIHHHTHCSRMIRDRLVGLETSHMRELKTEVSLAFLTCFPLYK